MIDPVEIALEVEEQEDISLAVGGGVDLNVEDNTVINVYPWEFTDPHNDGNIVITEVADNG